MDEVRRIRFLVSPALFVASLLIGALSDPTGEGRKFILDILTGGEWSKSLVGLVAGGGIAVFAGGYVFGTITVFILRLMFLRRPVDSGRFHEVVLSKDSFQQVWERLDAPGEEPVRSQELFAGAAFDYAVLRKHHEGVHEWLFRRWNGFNIAANSISALALSLPAGYLIGIPWSPTWYLSVGIFVFCLWWVMFWAWNDTMDMVEFMASLEAKKQAKKLGLRRARRKLRPFSGAPDTD
jgi:hypothetical protein